MLTFIDWLHLENAQGLKELKPTKEIGKGHFGNVFATDNPNIIMKIESPNNDEQCDKIMNNPQMQATGGVAIVYGQENQEINGKLFKITYKEKVDTNWATYIANKHKNKIESLFDIDSILPTMHMGLETASKIGKIEAFLQLALEAFRSKEHIINLLNIFPEAIGLVKAIQLGLNYDDLHSDNLGINVKGNLVAIDC